MKRFSFLAICLIALAATSTIAAPNPSTAKVPAFPGILVNARYVYVASYDGDQFDPNLFPEDRGAIGAVQNAIQEWGKLIVVYRPSEADIIILVTSRPSEDLLAVYDARHPGGNFLDFWCYQTMHSRIEPMKKIARTLRAHRPLLLNYFKAKKQFSSGVIEGLNNKAKVTIRRSYGLRTFRILELALYHSLGKLPEPELTHDFF